MTLLMAALLRSPGAPTLPPRGGARSTAADAARRMSSRSAALPKPLLQCRRPVRSGAARAAAHGTERRETPKPKARCPSDETLAS